MNRIQNDATAANEQSPAVRFITIDEDYAGQRVDNFLLRILKGVPKTRIYRIIRKGEVRVNKKKVVAAYRLKVSDVLRVPPVRISEKTQVISLGIELAEKLKDTILFEDASLIVINKPSGMAVHGGSGVSFGVIEVLRTIRPQERHLELVHRLDRDTSGCLMIAKKRSMLRYLHGQFQQDRIRKVYHAMVSSRWPSRKKLVNAPLRKNMLRSGERMVCVDIEEGKRSKTRYQVLERFCHQGHQATLLEASPVTGRTHQIRVHCLHAGYPILGDDKYTPDEDNRIFRAFGLKRLFLHAAQLTLFLSDGQKLVVEAPLPEDLQSVLRTIRTP